MKNLLNILQKYYWLSLSLFLLFPSAFASNLVFDDEKKSDTPPPLLNEEKHYIDKYDKIATQPEKKEVLKQHQVDDALKIALQQNNKEKKFEKNSVMYAMMLHSIALAYEKQEEYNVALKLYNQVLNIYKQTLGQDCLEYTTILNNIAAIYDKQEQYDLAIQYYKEVLKIQGKKHPNYTSTLPKIGLIYYKQALKKREDRLNQYQYNTSSSVIFSKLGAVYDAQGEYGAAIEHYKQALQTRKKKLGKCSNNPKKVAYRDENLQNYSLKKGEK